MARKKITVTTDNSKWEAPPRKKFRKPRKPMTEEQRKAASERLAKAREARAAKNPDYGKSGVHQSIRELNDDHQLHPDKVKDWIKTQKDLVKTERAAVRQNIKGAIAKLANHEGYIRNMQTYLRTGDWVDNFYGEHQQGKVKWRCTALSYHWYGPKKGLPKRDVGTFYNDLGCTWTKEMALEE
tara:strand:+ start:2923 stop:3471 length:549 start_codon:yes stop_codon:yes gene_type:complete